MDRAEKLAQKIKNSRVNNVFGENDPVIKKLLVLGCTAAFRGPNDIIYARSDTNLYFVQIVIQLDTVKAAIPNTDLEHLCKMAEVADATPLYIVYRKYCQRSKVYSKSHKKQDVL